MRICMTCAVLGLVLAGASSEAFADEKSHRAAAEDLLESANMEKTAETIIDQAVAAQVKTNPKLKPLEGVMKKFFTKHLGYSAMKEDMIKIYVAEFTEAELKQIAAFNRTPAGKKVLEKMPALMQKGIELGLKRMQENQAELEEMIEEELKKKRK